jgi:hypothetical protein
MGIFGWIIAIIIGLWILGLLFGRSQNAPLHPPAAGGYPPDEPCDRDEKGEQGPYPWEKGGGLLAAIGGLLVMDSLLGDTEEPSSGGDSFSDMDGE